MFGQISDHKGNSFILIKDYENYVSCEVFTLQIILSPDKQMLDCKDATVRSILML
jgi:hypothetical protein